MRVLVAHVAYRHQGGEDVVVDSEVRLLKEAGHHVAALVVPSDRFQSLPIVDRVSIVGRMGDHAVGHQLIREAIDEHRPDIVHFHNLYPLFGPGAMLEAARAGCATVQTFHNYRMSCVAGTHYWDGEVCEKCRPRSHTAGVIRGCYRQSRLQSAAMSRGVSAQWEALVELGLPHVGLCLTDFMRERLSQYGARPETLLVKPNSVDSGQPLPWNERRGACFVGRLSSEKGAAELLSHWSEDLPPLTVIGDGPEGERIRTRYLESKNIILSGQMGAAQVRSMLRQVRVLILPSLWYEGGLPLVALEALSEGTPVAAFDLGAMRDLRRLSPALASPPGDFDRLVQSAVSICQMPPREWAHVSEAAEAFHQSAYTHERNVVSLAAAYDLATGYAAGRVPGVRV